MYNSKSNYERPEVDYRLRKATVSPGQTLGLGCVEGAFLCHAVPCSITIDDSAYIPLMLFMQYLTQLEGPFWRQIRGQGKIYKLFLISSQNQFYNFFSLLLFLRSHLWL